MSLSKTLFFKDLTRPDLGVYHSQYLSSTFWRNFMKIRTKIVKLQLYENLHTNVNENMFSFTFLCKFL